MRKNDLLLPVIGFALLMAAPAPSLAKCGGNATDDAAVMAAREDIGANCNCSTAANHGAYVKCAAGRANFLSSPAGGNVLPKNCKGAVIKCAAKSTCGKPGAVTCCLTKGATTKCKVVKSADKCMSKHGTVGGMGGGHTSCCSNTAPLTADACTASPSGAFLDSVPVF